MNEFNEIKLAINHLSQKFHSHDHAEAEHHSESIFSKPIFSKKAAHVDDGY